MANIPFNNNVTQFVGSGLGQPQSGPAGGANPMMDWISKIMGQAGGAGGIGATLGSSPFGALFSKMMPQGMPQMAGNAIGTLFNKMQPSQQQPQTLPMAPAPMGAASPPSWAGGPSNNPLATQSPRPPMSRGMGMMNGIFGAR